MKTVVLSFICVFAPSIGCEKEDGKRKHWMIFLKRTREGHCQSDEHWNCFKGNSGETVNNCWRSRQNRRDLGKCTHQCGEMQGNNSAQVLSIFGGLKVLKNKGNNSTST